MAHLDQYAYSIPEESFTSYGDPNDPHNVEMARLRKASDELPEGEIVGGLLSWGRGDGYAFYIVKSARPLTLQWIPTGDNWQVEDALIKGLTKADIKQMLHGQKALSKLFGSSI